MHSGSENGGLDHRVFSTVEPKKIAQGFSLDHLTINLHSRFRIINRMDSEFKSAARIAKHESANLSRRPVRRFRFDATNRRSGQEQDIIRNMQYAFAVHQ